MVSGIISAGFGLGSFVFSWIAFAMINPDNKKAELEPNHNKNYKFYP
jgi:hypothetical protein